MTEKLGQIQGNLDSVRVSGGVQVIRVRVTGVLLYCYLYLVLVNSSYRENEPFDRRK